MVIHSLISCGHLLSFIISIKSKGIAQSRRKKSAAKLHLNQINQSRENESPSCLQIHLAVMWWLHQGLELVLIITLGIGAHQSIWLHNRSRRHFSLVHFECNTTTDFSCICVTFSPHRETLLGCDRAEQPKKKTDPINMSSTAVQPVGGGESSERW